MSSPMSSPMRLTKLVSFRQLPSAAPTRSSSATSSATVLLQPSDAAKVALEGSFVEEKLTPLLVSSPR